MELKVEAICPYCKRRRRFNVRHGEDDFTWRMLRPTRHWTAPIFTRELHAPATVKRCECGAMFVFAKDPSGAVGTLRRGRGAKRAMSVEETDVEVGGFKLYALKRMAFIERYSQTVAGKYKSAFRKTVIPSGVPAKEGYYAIYHEGDDLILRYVGEGVPPPPPPKAGKDGDPR